MEKHGNNDGIWIIRGIVRNVAKFDNVTIENDIKKILQNQNFGFINWWLGYLQVPEWSSMYRSNKEYYFDVFLCPNKIVDNFTKYIEKIFTIVRETNLEPLLDEAAKEVKKKRGVVTHVSENS